MRLGRQFIVKIMFIIIQYKENYYKKIQKLLINKLVELLNLKKTKMNQKLGILVNKNFKKIKIYNKKHRMVTIIQR